jgi:hypothetical protein
MKRYLSLAIAMTMFVAVVVTTARSQSANSQLMRARIPFAFHVGSRELPAGEYSITVLNPSSDRKVLQIRSADGRFSAITSTLGHKVNTPEQSKLVFRRYGDSYFFAQAQVAGESNTLAALKSNAETKEERMIASHGRPATVSIAAE